MQAPGQSEFFGGSKNGFRGIVLGITAALVTAALKRDRDRCRGKKSYGNSSMPTNSFRESFSLLAFSSVTVYNYSYYETERRTMEAKLRL